MCLLQSLQRCGRCLQQRQASELALIPKALRVQRLLQALRVSAARAQGPRWPHAVETASARRRQRLNNAWRSGLQQGARSSTRSWDGEWSCAWWGSGSDATWDVEATGSSVNGAWSPPVSKAPSEERPCLEGAPRSSRERPCHGSIHLRAWANACSWVR